MMGYIERRKRLTDAVAAMSFILPDSPEVVALQDLDAACQPQVNALVEAVKSWQRARLGLSRVTEANAEFNYSIQLSDATKRLDAAAAALDARADEVAKP